MKFLDLPSEIHNHILDMIENNDTTDAYREILKFIYISKYMKILAQKNIKSRNLFPRPKFKKGMFVKFKKSWLFDNKEIIDNFKKEFNSDINNNKLCIIRNPILDPTKKAYYYYIDYGLMDEVEGYIFEKDIDLV